VAEFRYTGVEDGTEKVRYRLEQGGFRAVTGAIGRTHKKNYVIETPIAHMGVRGTDHETYYFPATGPVSGEGAKPGAYNKVNVGRTFIRTGAGEVEIEPNQVGFVASANDVPVILPTVPGFFNRSIAPRNARPAVNSAPEAVEIADVKQGVETATGLALVGARGRAGSVAAGTGMGPLAGFSVSAGPAGFGASGNGVAIVPNGAVLAELGGDAAWKVNWGSWQGVGMTVGGQPVNGAVHVISSMDMTKATQLAALPTGLVNATYSYVGGPAPTNQAGVQGTINSLAVGVNFSSQNINYALNASAGGANWTANGGGSIAQFTGVSGIALAGGCTGCQGMGTQVATGTAHGIFVGTQAEKMISAFGLSAAGKSISGAAYLAR
jgi:hypothetical protein